MDNCPHCRAALPQAIRQLVEDNFRPRRPILLTIQIALGYILGSIILVSVLGIFDPGISRNFFFRGRPMTHGEFMFFQVITSLFPAVALIWSSSALRRNRADARKWLFLAVFLLFIGSAVTSQIQIPSLYEEIPPELYPQLALMNVALSFLMLLFAYWYLYKSGKAHRYFKQLEYLEQQNR